MIASDVQAADVVEPAVVRLANERVDRTDLLVARLGDRVADDGVNRHADAERIRQDDRRFDRAELRDLRRARQLAKRIADEHRAGDLVLKQLPVCGTIAVTPVRTRSPSTTVVCPTRTPSTSVMALRAPRRVTPARLPRSRALGLVWAPATINAETAESAKRHVHNEPPRYVGASACQVADRSSSTVRICSSKRRHLRRQLIEAREDFLGRANVVGRGPFREEADGAAGSELGPFDLLERSKALL
jgi:hypothetical protein